MRKPMTDITRKTLDPDDETCAICPTCEEGFTPGADYYEYRYLSRDESREDDISWFHVTCEP